MTFFSRPDTTAADQYFGTSRKRSLEPHERLMLAVLEDAIVCFQQYQGESDGKRERLFREAKQWIIDDDSEWPFSFKNICEALRLSVNYVRCGLLRKESFMSDGLKQQRSHLPKTRMTSPRRITKPRAA
jgi:hypothetical protein